MTGPDPARQTTAAYNKIASAYAGRWFDISLEAQLESFAACVKPGGLILDLGCGPGRDMLALQKRGFRAVGLDRSAGMLAEAAGRETGPLVLADMRRLPFARHTFNGVWASASLLHLPKAELPAALTEIFGALNHGHIYLSVKEGQAEGWFGDGDNRKRYFAFYHPAEIELALERANFHVLHFALTADAGGRDERWINAIGWTKLNTPKVGANAVIFNPAGEVLLTRRADNGRWCVPGGHLEPGETIQTTAIREALEETGLTVEIERLSGMYNVSYPASLFPEQKPRHIFIVAFRCRAVSGSLTLNDEVTEFGWFALSSLPANMLLHQRERILDAALPP